MCFSLWSSFTDILGNLMDCEGQARQFTLWLQPRPCLFPILFFFRSVYNVHYFYTLNKNKLFIHGLFICSNACSSTSRHCSWSTLRSKCNVEQIMNLWAWRGESVQGKVPLTGNFWPAISVGEFCRGGGCRSPWETRYCSRLTSVAQESAQVWRCTTLLEQRSSKRGWDWNKQTSARAAEKWWSETNINSYTYLNVHGYNSLECV